MYGFLKININFFTQELILQTETLIFASHEVSFANLSNVWVENNHVAEIVGWGTSVNGEPRLQKMKVKVETPETCRKSYTHVSYTTSKTICGTKVYSNDILFNVIHFY